MIDRLQDVYGSPARIDYLILLLTGVTVLQAEFPFVVEPLIASLDTLPMVSSTRATQLPTLFLLLLIIYSLLPAIYPKWLGEPVRALTSVRVAMACVGFLVAQNIYLTPNKHVSGTSGPIWDVIVFPNLVVVTFGGAILMALAFHRVQNPPLSSPEGIAMKPLLRMSSDDNPAETWRKENDKLRQESRGHWRVYSALVTLAIGLQNVLPVLFLGFLAGVLSRFYPVLELVAVTRVVTNRWPSENLDIRSLNLPDLEDEFYRRISLVRTPPSWAVLLSIIVGVAISMSMYTMVAPLSSFDSTQWHYLVRAVAEVIESPSVSSVGYAIEKGIDVVSHTAFAITPWLMALYSLWFWMRVIRRVPALFRVHLAETRAYLEQPADRSVSRRPKGYLLPLLPLSLLYAHYFAQPIHYLGVSLDGTLFLVLWFGSVALLAITFYWSRGTSTYGSVSSVQYEAFIPCLITFLSVILLFPTLMSPSTVLAPVILFLLLNVMYYSLRSDSQYDLASEWRLVAVAAVVVSLAGFLQNISTLYSIGSGVLMLGIWIFFQQVRKRIG